MSGRIRPVRSARPMNASGRTRPWPGRSQRTSASTPADARADVELGLVVQDQLRRRRPGAAPAPGLAVGGVDAHRRLERNQRTRCSLARAARRRPGAAACRRSRRARRRCPRRRARRSPARRSRPAARAPPRRRPTTASARASSQTIANASPPVRATSSPCPMVRARRSRDGAQDGVAGVVAERVVDVGEPDEVDHHDRGRVARARRAGARACAPAPGARTRR